MFKYNNNLLIPKIAKLCSLLNSKNITYVDVGCNTGKFASQLFDHLGKKKIIGNVHLFEPNIFLYKKIKNNLSKSNWNININIGIGLGSKKSKEKLNIYNDSTASSIYTVTSKIKKISKNYIKNKKINIILDKLDNYKKISHINLLKIDAQGSELEVLKGAKNLLKKSKIDIIIVELETCETYNNHFKISEFFKFMETYNYKLHSILTANYTKRNYISYCDLCFFSTSFWNKLGYW
jgi:FkbM family methyltransferase